MKKTFYHFGFYFGLIGTALVTLILILKYGPSQDINTELIKPASDSGWFPLLIEDLQRNIHHPVSSLLLQILVVLGFCRLFAIGARWLGQPQVVGEMIAGILLGKSVLAQVWPEGFGFIFPEAAMPRLFILSQVGLIFFMFVVGLDLKVDRLKNRAAAAVLVSHVSIVFPFVLGALASLWLYKLYAPANVSFASFALFMGISMSITAFPVLARIIQERNLTDTKLGNVAITCAAIDDVTAWCLLATVVGLVKAGTFSTAVAMIIASVVYVAMMLKVVRPALARFLVPKDLSGGFSKQQFAVVLFVVLASAMLTEIIGIHALFGAFLAGFIMPRSESFRAKLVDRIEDISTTVFLPLFFTYTGIRMQLGTLTSLNDWLICAGLIVIAVLGKMVGSALAARWVGISWRESWALGALMNTRGLMELVVLNIGLDLGILSPQIFAMMVLMAILTTMMAGPILTFLMPKAGFEISGKKPA